MPRLSSLSYLDGVTIRCLNDVLNFGTATTTRCPAGNGKRKVPWWDPRWRRGRGVSFCQLLRYASECDIAWLRGCNRTRRRARA